MDLFDGLVSIDHPQEVVLYGVEDLTAELEGFPPLEFIALPVTDSDPFEGGVEGKIEQEEQVGTGCELLVNPADFGRVESAHALVGHGGEIIAIEDDDFSALQGRVNKGFHMLGAILVEKFQFLFGREAPGSGGFPEPATEGSVGGFTRENHPVTLCPQGFGEEAGLGRLAGAVDPFQDD